MEWFRFYDEALDDPKVQELPPALFRTKFLAAVRGEQNEFSPHLMPDRAKGRLSACEWAVLRAQVYKRDNYTCQYCGRRGTRLECDHIVPVSRGGSNSLENLATACFTCNRSKHTKTLEEWLR